MLGTMLCEMPCASIMYPPIVLCIVMPCSVHPCTMCNTWCVVLLALLCSHAVLQLWCLQW